MIHLEFQYTEADLLEHQLFIISQSKQVRKQRAKSKIFLLLIYAAIGFFIWERNGTVTAAVFFVVCLPLYFIYGYMEKRQYANHVKNYIKQLIEQRGDRKTTVDVSDDVIVITDAEKNEVSPRMDIERIVEANTFYSLSLKNGKSLLIPKRTISNPDTVQPILKRMADKFGLEYVTDLKWKWN